MLVIVGFVEHFFCTLWDYHSPLKLLQFQWSTKKGVLTDVPGLLSLSPLFTEWLTPSWHIRVTEPRLEWIWSYWNIRFPFQASYSLSVLQFYNKHNTENHFPYWTINFVVIIQQTQQTNHSNNWMRSSVLIRWPVDSFKRFV